MESIQNKLLEYNKGPKFDILEHVRLLNDIYIVKQIRRVGSCFIYDVYRKDSIEADYFFVYEKYLSALPYTRKVLFEKINKIDLSMINDVEYFKYKLFKACGVPKRYWK
jgi:hypothetical protein